MSGFDPGSAIADLIQRLATSPRVQAYGKQAGIQLRNAAPMASGPFSTSNSGIAPQYQASGSNVSGTFRGVQPSTGQGIGSRLGAVANILGNVQGQPADPMQDLYSQLLQQLQTPVAQPAAIDKEDLMRQVQKAINPIYDAREATAKSNTSKASADVQSMYGQLAKNYQDLAPEQIKQAKEAQSQVEALYGQLRSNIEGSYSRVSKEQKEMFESLGIQDALPDVLSDQAPAVQQASEAASENQAQQQQYYLDQGQTDSTFYREGSPIAKMRGNEISTEMISKLQDYINQAEAERTSGIQTGYMDQLGQAQANLTNQQQAAASQTNNNQQMLWQMLQSQLNAKQQPAAALTPDSFMGSLPQGTQQGVGAAFTQLQRSPEAVYGKVEDPRNPVPGSFVDTSPEWYEAQADKMLQNGSIDAATHQALLMYMQLYFKQGQ
jgi:hypothetical protein